jgi:hypothetical protein
MTKLYCLRFETPQTWRARSPYLYPPETGCPNYTPRHWVPFPSPPTRSQGYGGSVRPRLHKGGHKVTSPNRFCIASGSYRTDHVENSASQLVHWCVLGICCLATGVVYRVYMLHSLVPVSQPRLVSICQEHNDFFWQLMKAIQHPVKKLPARQSLCNVADPRIRCPRNEGNPRARTSLTSDDTGRFGKLCGDMFDPISAIAERRTGSICRVWVTANHASSEQTPSPSTNLCQLPNNVITHFRERQSSKSLSDVLSQIFLHRSIVCVFLFGFANNIRKVLPSKGNKPMIDKQNEVLPGSFTEGTISCRALYDLLSSRTR